MVNVGKYISPTDPMGIDLTSKNSGEKITSPNYSNLKIYGFGSKFLTDHMDDFNTLSNCVVLFNTSTLNPLGNTIHISNDFH